jgi:hypothetical protein
MKTVFMGLSIPERNGAEGLLESLLSVLDNVNVDTKKCTGITTDGESANTGKKGGLWRLLNDHFAREVLTVWCCTHRTDLATEDIMNAVPELKAWKSELKSVATFFRTSKNHTKMLEKEFPDARKFPRHHDVRFAEHLVNLIDACLYNLEACKRVWKNLGEQGERKEKAESIGYLRTWDYNQQRLTALMGDTLEIFSQMEKKFQRNDLIMPDLFTCRDAALRKLGMIEEGPYPGKREYKVTNVQALDDSESSDRRNTNHQFVTRKGRAWNAIRTEVIMSAKSFLSQRVNLEQEKNINDIAGLLSKNNNLNDFIKCGNALVTSLFPDEVGTFADESCELWEQLRTLLIS